MKLKGKKVAILVENLYDEKEFWVPYYRMKEEGAEVIIVGSGSAPIYRGKNQIEVVVDKPADAVSADDFDAIIIPGGFAPDYLRRYGSVLKLVGDAFVKNKVIASICHGAWVLVSAGILKGKRATCFFAIKDDVCNAGAEYSDSEVVMDGNLITSRKPDDLPAFCKAIITALVGG